MTENNKKQDVKTRHGPRWLWTAVIAEFAFLCTGVFLTLAAFLFLGLFVDQLVRNEYERVSEDTVTVLAKEFSDLERSIRTAGMLLSVSENAVSDAIFSRIWQTDPGLEHFDQIILLRRNAGGQWAYKNLYQKPAMVQDMPVFAVKTDPPFLQFLVQQNFFTAASPQVVTERSFFSVRKTGETPEAVQTNPFVLIMPIKRHDMPEALIMGVGHAGTVLNTSWHREHPQILKIVIRDVDAAADLYKFEYKGESIRKLDGGGQVYEFNFGGHLWEARTDYIMEQKVYFLNAIPYLVIVFGFILTTAGTLYIHGTQRQSLRVASINNMLEDKNRELESEMAKRERLNSMIKKSEQENRAVIDSVSDIIFETDTQGKILFLNATWRKITGFNPEQSKGTELISMLHPQDQEKQRTDFHSLVRGHKNTYRSFTRLRTADGNFRAVELSISMIRADESKNFRVVGTLTDVEERRRAERALAEAEKKYRTIVENAAGGIFQLTPEGVYLSANPACARILGYKDPEDLLLNVKNANESVYFNGRERQYFLKELESSGTINNYETQIIRKDGARIWVNENVRVVKDDSGAVLYYEGSLEDITQRKEAETGLKEAKIHSDLANRAKSEFLANMSHELRTPLNAIIGFSEIIKNESFGPLGQNAYKEYANDIHESGRKLLSIINEILDISKIEAGERHLNEQIVDIHALVDAAMNMLENKARTNNLIVSNMLRNVPQIVGEELAIKQVLVNLLSNAIKFTPVGGRITITNETDADGSLRVSITDTGIGLDENEIEKALSPFGQVHNSFSRTNAGTGLGLTLAQALIKLHEGRLELFSQKGIGTTATIVFPVDRVAPNKDSVQEKPKNYRNEKTV